MMFFRSVAAGSFDVYLDGKWIFFGVEKVAELFCG